MGGYSASELFSIFTMQGFAGLSLFCVLLLMALGLAIIFGQIAHRRSARFVPEKLSDCAHALCRGVDFNRNRMSENV